MNFERALQIFNCYFSMRIVVTAKLNQKLYKRRINNLKKIFDQKIDNTKKTLIEKNSIKNRIQNLFEKCISEAIKLFNIEKFNKSQQFVIKYFRRFPNDLNFITDSTTTKKTKSVITAMQFFLLVFTKNKSSFDDTNANIQNQKIISAKNEMYENHKNTKTKSKIKKICDIFAIKIKNVKRR